MPKERYFPSGGGAGGKRYRSSSGRDRISESEVDVGSGGGEERLWELRYSFWRSRFWEVKYL